MKQMMAILGVVIAGLAGAVHGEDDSNISTAERHWCNKMSLTLAVLEILEDRGRAWQ